MNQLQVVLVDDHDVVRSGLIALLNTWDNIKVKADFSSGEHLLAQLNVLEGADILILDNLLTGISGEETYTEVRRLGWEGPVLMLTVASEEAFTKSMVDKGVFRVLLKSEKPDALQSAIWDAVKGRTGSNIVFARSLHNRITPREMEFLKLICDEREFTYEQIADSMNVHVRTVDGFRKSLFQKLNVKSKTGLVLYAIKQRLFYQ